jgi:hypothetical protein
VLIKRLNNPTLPHYIRTTGWEACTYAFKPLVVAGKILFFIFLN